MGLDGVELVMAFEEAFGVTITDGEAATTVTPGMVVDLVCTKLSLTDDKTCQSQRAFYLLRRAVMRVFSKQRNQVSPDTPLRELFPGWDCTLWWFELQRAVDARSWPKLEQPSWVGYAIFIFAFCVLVATPAFLTARYAIVAIGLAVSIGVVAFVATAILLTIAAKPLQRALPRRVKTVRDLIPYVTTTNSMSWTREAVAKVVKDTVIEQLGLEEKRYSESARFVEDLGLDQ